MVKNKGGGAPSSSKKVRKQILGILAARQENKHFGSTIAASATNVSIPYALTQPIVQGLSGGQRAGDSIFVKTIKARLTFEANAAGGLTQIGRVTLVMDHMNDGTAIVVADVFDSSLVTAMFSSQVTEEHRLKIIGDWLIPTCITGPGVWVKEVTFKINKKVFFNATTNVAGANGKNAIFCLVVSNSASNYPGFNADFEIVFTDS